MFNKTTRARLSLIAIGGLFALASFLVVRRVPDVASGWMREAPTLLVTVPIVAFLTGAVLKAIFGREGAFGWGLSAVGVAIVTTVWIALSSAIALVFIPIIREDQLRGWDFLDLREFLELIVDGAFERVTDTILTSSAGPLWLVLMVAVHMVARHLRRPA